MGVIVKVCGITNARDALAAVENGADALGFVFFSGSPRHVTLAKAAEIASRLPGHVVKVGVFVDADPDEVLRARAACGLNLLQFHGDESPEYCLQFGARSMKAFRIRNAESLKALPRYRTDAWLLDAYSPRRRGGTGEVFEWRLAIEAGKLGRPIILAGGLRPENVADAIAQVRPYGVDVSSGVESRPGQKDHARLKAFLRAAKAGAGREAVA